MRKYNIANGIQPVKNQTIDSQHLHTLQYRSVLNLSHEIQSVLSKKKQCVNGVLRPSNFSKSTTRAATSFLIKLFTEFET